MRVFVIGTGRCGTLSFAKACEHITNYSSGHETHHKQLGPTRWEYPDRHIEVDNRLSWGLGRLIANYPCATYVWLRRNREAVAKSYLRRWDLGGGILPAYGRGVLRVNEPSLELALDLVDTIESNIRVALPSARGSVFTVALERIGRDFEIFWKLIAARGSYEQAMGEFAQCHNRSK